MGILVIGALDKVDMFKAQIRVQVEVEVDVEG